MSDYIDGILRKALEQQQAEQAAATEKERNLRDSTVLSRQLGMQAVGHLQNIGQPETPFWSEYRVKTGQTRTESGLRGRSYTVELTDRVVRRIGSGWQIYTTMDEGQLTDRVGLSTRGNVVKLEKPYGDDLKEQIGTGMIASKLFDASSAAKELQGRWFTDGMARLSRGVKVPAYDGYVMTNGLEIGAETTEI